MEFGLFEILKLIGALGFFIYGMKIMSDGIQKLAGNKMREILGKMTNNKFAGIFTGFFTTSVIQSSSATTVMVVSFVNAGLLTLKQAIGVIMGANIGTTITAFLILGLGFGKVSLASYALPIIAFGLPLLFMKKDQLRSLGDFLIGFALLFMGLDYLKSSVPKIDDGKINYSLQLENNSNAHYIFQLNNNSEIKIGEDENQSSLSFEFSDKKELEELSKLNIENIIRLKKDENSPGLYFQDTIKIFDDGLKPNDSKKTSLSETNSFTFNKTIEKEDGGILQLIDPLTGFGIFSIIIFVLIGTLITVIVQSSSAAMALTLVLCSNGLPLEFAAAIVLGENIGTTITANLAALIGNIYAKRAAMAHLIFNVFGVIWMLFVFYFIIDGLEYIMAENSLNLPLDNSTNEKYLEQKTQWSLALFHLTFNIINTSLLIWFIPNIERIATRLIPTKDEEDELFQLKYIGTGALTNEFSLIEAKKELIKFGKITHKMNGFTQKLLVSTEQKKANPLLQKIEKYEEITDRIETEIVEFLSKVSEGELSESSSIQIRSMLGIAGDLETIGDIYYQISKNIERKINERIYFIPEQRNKILKMLEKLDVAYNIMIENLESDYTKVKTQEALDAEKEINQYRNKLRKEHLKSTEKSEYNIRSGMIYSDLFSSCEKIGDHIINVSEGIVGEV